MIYLGTHSEDKPGIVGDYVRKNSIRRVVVISSVSFPTPDAGEVISFPDVIKYVVFYRLMQEIDGRTLLVIDECLRTQNRYELAYNCVRNFLNQTSHQIIFQFFPLIDGRDDYMILFDFDTRSAWKRRPFDKALVSRRPPEVVNRSVSFSALDVQTSDKTRAKYEAERERLFSALGARDPNTIPRNLYLIGGQDKIVVVNDNPDVSYVARNGRLRAKHGNVFTYRDDPLGQVSIIELPHRFLDFTDYATFMAQEFGQRAYPVLVADLKVDRWYMERYQQWSERLDGLYTDLHR